MRPSAFSSLPTFRTPLFSADVLKECSLIALHVIAEEGRDGDGCHVPGLGDEWKMGCPHLPMWESEGEAWSEDESVSSSGSRKGNVGNEALHVIGLYGPGGKISFPAGLGAGKGGIEMPHGPGHVVPGNALSLVAGLPLPGGPLSQQEKPFSHHGRAVTKKERDVV